MENNEVFEIEETTNETEEVVNEEENEEEEVTEESGTDYAGLVVIGAGLAVAGAVYGTVKGIKWLCKKAVKKARKHKKVKENTEQLTTVLENDAKEEPMNVDVPNFTPIDAD